MKRSPWIADLQWARPAQQDRSRKTFNLILDAAEQLFGEQGVDQTSVAAVARAAGCSVGSVYHHFRDKAALVAALFDRTRHEFMQTLDAAVEPARWQGATISEILEGYLQFSLEMSRSTIGSGSKAHFDFALREKDLRAQIHVLHFALFDRLRVLLLARKSEIGHPDPELAVAFILDQLRVTIFLNDSSDLLCAFEPLPQEQVVSEALTMACQYLRIKQYKRID